MRKFHSTEPTGERERERESMFVSTNTNNMQFLVTYKYNTNLQSHDESLKYERKRSNNLQSTYQILPYNNFYVNTVYFSLLSMLENSKKGGLTTFQFEINKQLYFNILLKFRFHLVFRYTVMYNAIYCSLFFLGDGDGGWWPVSVPFLEYFM